MAETAVHDFHCPDDMADCTCQTVGRCLSVSRKELPLLLIVSNMCQFPQKKNRMTHPSRVAEN